MVTTFCVSDDEMSEAGEISESEESEDEDKGTQPDKEDEEVSVSIQDM